MLHECVGVKPDFPAFSSMAVRKNFLLISRRDFLPPSNMLEFASLIGFGASLIVETKEGATNPKGTARSFGNGPCNGRDQPW